MLYLLRISLPISNLEQAPKVLHRLFKQIRLQNYAIIFISANISFIFHQKFGHSKKSYYLCIEFHFMKHLIYIVILLLSFGIRFFALPQQHTAGIEPAASADCYLSEPDAPMPYGLLGQSIHNFQGGLVESAVPTHFSTHANRPSWGKNRSRTAFLRMMLHHYQPLYILFRGKVRMESAPFAIPNCSAYYVYALQRLLC